MAKNDYKELLSLLSHESGHLYTKNMISPFALIFRMQLPFAKEVLFLSKYEIVRYSLAYYSRRQTDKLSLLQVKTVRLLHLAVTHVKNLERIVCPTHITEKHRLEQGC